MVFYITEFNDCQSSVSYLPVNTVCQITSKNSANQAIFKREGGNAHQQNSIYSKIIYNNNKLYFRRVIYTFLL